MRYGVALSLVFLCLGCSLFRSVHNVSLDYRINKGTEVRVVRSDVPQKVQSFDVGSRAVDKVDSLRFHAKFVGQARLDVFVRYVCDLVGMTLAGVDVAKVFPIVDVDIDSDFSRDELVSLMSITADGVGYVVRVDGNVVSFSEYVERKEGIDYVKYVPMVYRSNNIDSLVASVRVLYFGSGVLLLGGRQDVLSLVEVIRLIDRDVFSSCKIVVIGYPFFVCRKVQDIVVSVENVKVVFLELSQNYSVLVLRDDKYLGYILDMLSSVSSKVVGDVYMLAVSGASMDRVDKAIREIMPDVKFYKDERGFVFTSFFDYERVKKLLRVIDVVERQLHVRMYLMDVQSRGSSSLGFDFGYDSARFSAVSGLRDRVGLALFGSFGDFQSFANFLVQKFDGRVLTSPSMVVRNNSESNISFGQSIPTLKSRQETSGGSLVQQVEYIQVGIGLTLRLSMSGDNVFADVNVNNSSVMESVGVEGNPQFSSDNIRLSMVMRLGNVAVVAGLRRNAVEHSRRFTIFPNNIFRKRESREFLVCLHVEEIGVVQDNSKILDEFSKNFLDKS